MRPNLNEAFVCILDRSGSDLPTGLVDHLAKGIDSYGGVTSTIQLGCIGVTIRHDGSRNPLSVSEASLLVAIAGQIQPLYDRADFQQSQPCLPKASVATWVKNAFLRKGVDFLAPLSGSFVFITADPVQGSLSIARDHLGHFKLYYYLDHRWLIAASEPAAILRHPAVADDIDKHSVARFLGFRFTHSKRSFFHHISELPPAHWLQVTPKDSRIRQYWRFPVHSNIHKHSREQVQSDFRRILRQSIENDMLGLEAGQVGLSLSGGLDSPVLAALAPRRPLAFSWEFKDAPDCNEHRNIEAVSEHLKLPVRWIKGDGAYPLCGDFIDRFVNENSPYCNAFAGLKHRLYDVARKNGCRLVMVGDGGDLLYAPQEYWLRDLLSNGHLAAFSKSAVSTFRKALQGDRFAQVSLRRLLPVRGIRNVIHQSPPSWLTPEAKTFLSPQVFSPIVPGGWWKYRYDTAIGAKNSELESEERRLFAQCGIGRSNPFWHWPLLEAILNLPAYRHHCDGRSKMLVREAMKNQLPDQVLNSTRVGLLGWFFLRGMEFNHKWIQETVFRRPRSDWQHYVKREWLEPYLGATQEITFGHTILWRVISYELWYRRLIGKI